MKAFHFSQAILSAVSVIMLGGFASLSAATWVTFQPAGVFTHDVIYENSQTPTVTTTLGSRYFYADALRGSATYVGLNDTGLYLGALGSENVPFQLQPYDVSNVRKLNLNQSVTVAVTPGSYDRFGLAAAAGNVGVNSPTLSYTLNYTDLSSSTGTYQVLDWGSVPEDATSVELFNVGRAAVGPVYEDTNRWSVFGTTFEVDPTKTLTSVVFTVSSTPNGGEVGLFAFSGRVVPEPSRVLLGVAGLGFGLSIRRRN